MSRLFLSVCMLTGVCAGTAVSAADVIITKGAASGKGYTWADVAKWPDFTTGTWSGGGGGPGSPGGATGGPPPGGAAGGRPSGVTSPGTGGPRGGGPGGDIPFKAEIREAQQAKRASAPVGTGNCEPMGVIADSGSAFYFSKDVIIIGGLSDWYNVWRRVYMDGRGHPKDVEPSYFGHSIGHWEGDTLVIDTVAVRAEAQIMQGMPIGNYDTHIVERFRLTGPNTMELQKTIENPQVFTKPWSTTRTLKRNTTEDYFESYCWQDRDSNLDAGLTPPP